MQSFEPLTLRSLGSSQAFQTGETFGGAPLIDYQHPHDLIMALAAAYERPLGTATVLVRGGVVDAPALGPTPFMHRETASLHPTVPLGHHQLDASHITHGVITGGIRSGRLLVEGSLFRGREPDENRTDLDLGALDSVAVRASWIAGGTRAQVSIGRLADPDPIDPGDMTRATASVEHAATLAGRAFAITLAWGQNRERFSTEASWLAEAALQLGRRGTAYVRGELVDKHILEAGGLHPPGFEHPHIISRVGALTGGYVLDLWRSTRQTFGIGGDVTGHRVPAELQEAYGRPVSIHVFGRWRAAARR